MQNFSFFSGFEREYRPWSQKKPFFERGEKNVLKISWKQLYFLSPVLPLFLHEYSGYWLLIPQMPR